MYFSSISFALSRTSCALCSSSKYNFFVLSTSCTQVCSSFCITSNWSIALKTEKKEKGRDDKVYVKLTRASNPIQSSVDVDTFLEICSLCILRLLASSAICCWKTSTAARRARASFSFSSSTVRHTFHMFLRSLDLPFTYDPFLGKLLRSISRDRRESKPVRYAAINPRRNFISARKKQREKERENKKKKKERKRKKRTKEKR